MPEAKVLRLSKVAQEFNISPSRVIEFLTKKGFTMDSNPNSKITPDMYNVLAKEFQAEKSVKEAANKVNIDISKRTTISIEETKSGRDDIRKNEEEDDILPILKNQKTTITKTTKTEKPAEPTVEKEVKKEEKTKTKKSEEVEEKTKKEDKEKLTAKEENAEIENIENKEEVVEIKKGKKEEISLKIKGKVNLENLNQKTKPDKKSKKKEVLETESEEEQHKDKKATTKKTTKKTKTEEVEQTPVVEAEEQKEEKAEIQEKPKKQKEEEVKPAEEEVIASEEIISQPQEKSEELIDITTTTVDTDIKQDEKVKETTETTVSQEEDENFIKTKYMKLEGPKVMGKMDLPVNKPPQKKDKDKEQKREAGQGTDFKKKRKRIEKVKVFDTEKPEDKFKYNKFKDKKLKKPQDKPEVKDEDIEKQIKETLARLTSSGKTKASKHRRQKREMFTKQREEEIIRSAEEKKILKVTEFVTANELASLMNVQINEIISLCLNLGIFVSINQRLDAETLTIVAEEFGYKVEFVTVDGINTVEEEEEDNSVKVDRAPIVTVMGHVDHGKTSLLDYIRKTNVIAGEAGGITQHIGAYEVLLENGKTITFLDTPGHEAFTAMRARGTKITDVVIIVVAADEDIMPQTKEAINHASAAGVPIVFAINKIDKPNANVEKIKEGLAKLNYLVEDWGGKYQCQEISAKKGTNVDLLLDKVLLEAELLELKANPDKRAWGTVIESSLDKGKGYVAKVLVQDGTLKIADILVAGHSFGRVKAMYNERNINIKTAGPSTPLLLLGLNSAPQAGDTFNVFADEHEAKELATKRFQLQREQSLRTQKHITLDEIGRRIAIGDFKQLNIIVKGDVDGSVEALADSLLKLTTDQVQVQVIHKSVGQITESDVLLASASDAVVIGFQVRPSPAARRLAQQEQIDIRLYSIIYNAINELKSAIEGMLSPEIEEKTVCNVEVKEVFRITKVGSVAGCFVLDGKLTRNTKVHLIRDGIVIYTGDLSSLKHYKDDVKEVKAGMECGLSIKNFNDIKVGDIIEGFEEIEIQRKL